MIDFLVSPTSQNGIQYNDLVIGADGNFETTTAISQKVFITFATWLGDWFFDLGFGVNYPKLKGNRSIEEVNLKMQSKLLSISGVIAITAFSSVFNAPNRVYSFSVQYKTTDNLANELELAA